MEDWPKLRPNVSHSPCISASRVSRIWPHIHRLESNKGRDIRGWGIHGEGRSFMIDRLRLPGRKEGRGREEE